MNDQPDPVPAGDPEPADPGGHVNLNIHITDDSDGLLAAVRREIQRGRPPAGVERATTYRGLAQ